MKAKCTIQENIKTYHALYNTLHTLEVAKSTRAWQARWKYKIIQTNIPLLIFFGPEVQSSQNIGWPIRIEELHNHFKTLKYHSKMARNKVKLKIGHLPGAISSFIVLVEDSILFLVKH